jgi:preprotein translocase subunit SecD
MQIWMRQFNLYFALMAALGLLCGCQSKKDNSPVGVLRVHLEATADNFDTSQSISLMRADPVLITIGKNPILTEANIVAAKVIDTPGGFAIEIQFDESSALMLEQYTASNPGKHLVIFGQWGDKISDGRWLAAPLITHLISNGILSFTPDCSREEADQLVLGLNTVSKKLHLGVTK